MVLVRTPSLLLFLLPLILGACGLRTPVQPEAVHGSGMAVSGSPAAAVQWNGVFSCTAHIKGRLPAITLKDIPLRQEGGRVTGLYMFTDSFKQRNSVMFVGTLNGQSARVAVTAIRTNGSTNFTADMIGGPASMTGRMMTGVSQRPVRLCTFALTRPDPRAAVVTPIQSARSAAPPFLFMPELNGIDRGC